MPNLLEIGSCYFFGYGWVGGWEEKWRLMLSQLPTEVEVEAELGNVELHCIPLLFSLYRTVKQDIGKDTFLLQNNYILNKGPC